MYIIHQGIVPCLFPALSIPLSFLNTYCCLFTQSFGVWLCFVFSLCSSCARCCDCKQTSQITRNLDTVLIAITKYRVGKRTEGH